MIICVPFVLFHLQEEGKEADGSDLGYPIILKENKISDIFKTLSQNIARKIAINNSK